MNGPGCIRADDADAIAVGRWPVRLPFSAFGARILVLANDPTLRARIEQQLPLGAIGGPVDTPDRVVRLVAGAPCRLYVGARLVRRAQRIDGVLAPLRRQLQISVARYARDYVFIHAGVVAWQGRAIVVPGRSFSGKSTLVHALLAAGASYMSDEFAFIDPRGWVRAYPRPLSLRRPDGGRTRLNIDSAVRDCLPIGTVLLTRFVPHRRWEPRTASAGEAMLALLANAVPARDAPRRALEAVKRAAVGATILSGERGDAAQVAVSLLTRLCVERTM